MRADLETEFKLRATSAIDTAAIDAAVDAAAHEAGLTCTASDSGRHVDTYFDDELGSLARAGIGLRLRADRSGQRLCCKRRSGCGGDGTSGDSASVGGGEGGVGLFVREEHDAPWPAAMPQQASELPPTLRDLVEPFTLDRQLTAFLRLETLRDTRLLLREEVRLCELAIDRVKATAAGLSAEFEEVEIEVLDDLPSNERLAASLLERLPLQAAADDKPSHAAALLGLHSPKADPPASVGEAPIGPALAAIAARHLTAMRHAEVGVRISQDPRHLHRMRVAVRRLRAVVRAFRDLWPNGQSTWILDHLADQGRRLGTVRDLDVMLASLPEATAELPRSLHAAGDDLVAWVQRQHEVARRGLREWLRNTRRLTECRELQRLLSTVAVSERGATSLALAVPPRIHRTVQAVRKLAATIEPNLPVQPLHRLRIASKRLRYLAEEFADLPPHAYAKSLASVVRLQQALGAVCDHEFAATRLLCWMPLVMADNQDDPLSAAALGGLAANHASAARRARKAARRCLRRVDRNKVWRRFAGPHPPDANLAS